VAEAIEVTMSFRTTIILMIVLIGVGVFFYIDTQKEEETADLSEVMLQEVFEGLRAADIQGLEIESMDTMSVTKLSRLGEESWVIEEPVQEDADGFRVENLALQLASLRSRRTFTDTAGLEEYGLDEPRLEIRIIAGERRETLQVGDVIPTGGYYYGQHPSGDRLYLLDATLVDMLRNLIMQPPSVPESSSAVSDETIAP
jgi:hypothetical protein